MNNSRKLTVALFTDTYTPDINGVSIAVDTLRKALEAYGHRVFVVAPTELSSIHSTVDVNGGVIRIPGIRLKKLYNYKLSRPVSIKAIKILKKYNIDICHVHTEFSMRLIAAAFASSSRVPLVYTYHTMYEDYTHYVTKGHADKLARKAVKLLSRLYGNSASQIIAPSRKTKSALLEYGVTQEISVIPTGLDLSVFKRKPENEALRSRLMEQYGLENKFVLLYLGRLAGEKNVDFLLNNIKAVTEAVPEAVLLIVGYGPDEDRLRAEAAATGLGDKIIFTGKQPHDRVGIMYSLGSVFVSASTSETQGLTYIEALASGIPVIAKKDECLEGIIENGRNGYLFEDNAGYLNAVKKVHGLAAAEYAEMCRAAQNTSEIYSLDVMAEKITEVYLKSLESKTVIEV